MRQVPTDGKGAGDVLADVIGERVVALTACEINARSAKVEKTGREAGGTRSISRRDDRALDLFAVLMRLRRRQLAVNFTGR